jgi:aspartokinase
MSKVPSTYTTAAAAAAAMLLHMCTAHTLWQLASHTLTTNLHNAGVPMIIRNTSDPGGPCTTIHAKAAAAMQRQSSLSALAAAAQAPLQLQKQQSQKQQLQRVPRHSRRHLPTCVTSLERLALLELRSRKLEGADSVPLASRFFKVCVRVQ